MVDIKHPIPKELMRNYLEIEYTKGGLYESRQMLMAQFRYYSGGESSGSGVNKNTSSSSGSGNSTSLSTSAPQLTPQQVLSMYGTALPSILNTTNTGVNNSVAAPALQAANQGAVAGVNAVNLNGLSPGEGNAVERSTNQQNQTTGNLGLNNPTNAVSNAMNFGGAFNSKIPLANAATSTASGVAGTGAQTLGTVGSLFNPISSSGNASVSNSRSNSLFANAGSSSGAGNSNQSGFNVGCFLTTACCGYKGLSDDCEELTILRKFRDEYVPKYLVERYYQIAPNICVKIQANVNDLESVYKIIVECVNDIKNNRKQSALDKYIDMVNRLEAIYG